MFLQHSAGTVNVDLRDMIGQVLFGQGSSRFGLFVVVVVVVVVTARRFGGFLFG